MHSLAYFMSMMKTKMSLTENAARVGEMTNAYGILVGDYEGKNLLGDSGLDGMIIVKWLSSKSMRICGLDLSG